jgi:formate hydrogenlyase subunit 3/multisubunit Na+/H+ antiporter MnhD subunit
VEDDNLEPHHRRRPGPAFDYLKHLSVLSTLSFLVLLLFWSKLLPATGEAGWQPILYVVACGAFLVSILAAQAGMWLEYAGSSAEEPERSGSVEFLLSLLSVWCFLIGILSLAVFLIPVFLPYLRQLVPD